MRRRLLDTPPQSVNNNGYKYVDLGLPSGLLWATCNIGADKPEDYGLYFAWGETTGYSSASEKNGGFTWETAPYWVSGTALYGGTIWSKYTVSDSSSSTGTADNKLVLEPEDDAAHIILGGDWRMPTAEEFQELYDSCNEMWTTQNGVKGKLLTSKINSNKTLFLPAAGYADGNLTGNFGVSGYYWSSSRSLINSSFATYMLVHMSADYLTNYARISGQSIRGVLSPNSI